MAPSPPTPPPPPPPIPPQMKAIQVTSYNTPYKLTTVPVPTLGPHDLLVKVAVASYCHTDSMVAAGTFHTPLPVTASHEGAGTVVAVGAEVQPSSFGLGDRVMCGLPLHPCGECGDCVGPEEFRQYCARVRGHVGVHVDGCFAEYVRVDERFATRLPDEVPLRDAAPLACAGRTIWRSVRIAGLKKGEWLAIVGSGGGLGHLGVQFARAMGIRVVGIDARDEGLGVSREAGADVVLDARKGRAEVVGEVQRVTGGEGARAAIVLADAEGATALAAAVTRTHGTVVQLAQPDEVKIPFHEFVFRDIRFRGSMLCSPEESKEMVRFIAEHSGKGEGEGGSGIKVETTAFEGLERIEELMKLVRSGRLRGKAVIVVDKEQR
ncbi:GroES-like protein [Hypoxylon sp. NC0597]|nr:GroES-like protein [Hypoxylon sp. NC0597]